MRLSEREAIRNRQRGVLTMEDVARDRRSREVAEEKAKKRRQVEAKAATRGPALLEVPDEP